MNTYLYDGSFEGLLSALFTCYPLKEDFSIQSKERFQPNLLTIPVPVETNPAHAQRVYDSIEKKLSTYTLQKVYYNYLSELPDCENLILQYLKLCYRYGDEINLAKNNDTIINIDRNRQKVSQEAHRFKGFVRFKEIGEKTYYAAIEPDHNILPLLLDHFVCRYSDQKMIIQDTKREYALIYDLNHGYFHPLSQADGEKILAESQDELYEILFQTFYQSVNIPERKNHRLRNQHMPKRYWKNLIELNQ